MINIEKAKQELIHYADKCKIQDSKVSKKLAHMMRVAKLSKELATQLNLVEEQIQVAELIGLLHDIGRFEEYRIFNKKVNPIMPEKTQFNHGEVGIHILKKENYIRNFVEEDTYDNILLTAVYEHNRYELSRGLTKEGELFSKIIKDADKIDLMYEAVAIYWQKPEDIQKIENGKVSRKMLEDFYQHKLADNRNSISKTDQILRFASFVFDLNFAYSFYILKENDNINKMIDRFNYQIPETKKEMRKVKEIANEEIERKIRR